MRSFIQRRCRADGWVNGGEGQQGRSGDTRRRNWGDFCPLECGLEHRAWIWKADVSPSNGQEQGETMQWYPMARDQLFGLQSVTRQVPHWGPALPHTVRVSRLLRRKVKSDSGWESKVSSGRDKEARTGVGHSWREDQCWSHRHPWLRFSQALQGKKQKYSSDGDHHEWVACLSCKVSGSWDFMSFSGRGSGVETVPELCGAIFCLTLPYGWERVLFLIWLVPEILWWWSLWGEGPLLVVSVFIVMMV